MGVFDFIKEIFSKEPEIIEELTLENIGEWLSKKYSSKQDFLKGQIRGIKTKISGEITSARQNMEKLSSAQLRNPNIPEKAKHFMEGNREAYIKKIEHFIERIEIPDDAGLVINFLSDFDKSIEEFGKSTARPFAILKEFFEEEASRIASNIRNIVKFIGEIKEALKKSKIKEMDEIKREAAGLKNKTTHKKFLKEEIKKKEERLEEFSNEKEKMEHEIKSKENSAKYKDYQMLMQRLNEAKKQSSEKQSELAHMFSSLERPMKKYLRVVYNDQDLLERYIESPVNALTQDFGLKIISILDNMKKAILDDSLELKDKQKSKAIQDIRALSKDFLSKFLSEYAQMMKKENELENELKSFTIMGELKALKEKAGITAAMLDKAKKDLENLNSEIEKIDLQKMKTEISEKIKSTIDIKVVIS